MKNLYREFFKFLQEYKVIGLAVAVIIGGKLNELVGSLVDNLLMPLIFQPALKAAGVDHINNLQFKGIFYGRVIGSGIDFLIVAFIVFVIAKYVLRQEGVKKI